jgi:hypothetical protein
MSETHIQRVQPWSFRVPVSSTVSTSLSGTTTIGAGATLTSPTITSPTITGATISGAIDSDFKVLAADATITSSTTLATLTGMTYSLVAGATYIFEVNLPITATTSGGIAVGFGLTTATLTSIQVQTYVSTAADNTTAVSSQSTTATSGTKYINTKTAAYTLATLKGSMVVNAAGTLAVQAAQETSAGGGDVTVVLKGAFSRFTRVA